MNETGIFGLWNIGLWLKNRCCSSRTSEMSELLWKPGMSITKLIATLFWHSVLLLQYVPCSTMDDQSIVFNTFGYDCQHQHRLAFVSGAETVLLKVEFQEHELQQVHCLASLRMLPMARQNNCANCANVTQFGENACLPFHMLFFRLFFAEQLLSLSEMVICPFAGAIARLVLVALVLTRFFFSSLRFVEKVRAGLCWKLSVQCSSYEPLNASVKKSACMCRVHM